MKILYRLICCILMIEFIGEGSTNGTSSELSEIDITVLFELVTVMLVIYQKIHWLVKKMTSAVVSVGSLRIFMVLC